MDILARLRRTLFEDRSDRPGFWPLTALHIAIAVARDLARGDLTLWAMSLVYTTLLSLVPLLAISFSVLKGFGVHNQIEPLLLELLTPLGPKAAEITERIIEFVENVKVGVLGTLGFALLFYTVVSLMQKIERAFNRAWRVSRERTLGQRFRDYLSVLVIGPVLIFTAVGLTATVMSAPVVESLAAIEPFGTAIRILGRLLPFAMIVGTFTFMYAFIPNTGVRLIPAFTGGVIAGVLWYGAGWLFAAFVVGSAKYTAIYSTFATLIFFMIWLYVGWLILLVGASIAFYAQNPRYATDRSEEVPLSERDRECYGLTVMALVADHFYRHRPAWALGSLAQCLQIRTDFLDEIVRALEGGGLLQSSGDDPPVFLPARPLEETSVADVLQAIRSHGQSLSPAGVNLLKPANALLKQAEDCLRERFAGTTIKELGRLFFDRNDGSAPGVAAETADEENNIEQQAGGPLA